MGAIRIGARRLNISQNAAARARISLRGATLFANMVLFWDMTLSQEAPTLHKPFKQCEAMAHRGMWSSRAGDDARFRLAWNVCSAWACKRIASDWIIGDISMSSSYANCCKPHRIAGCSIARRLAASRAVLRCGGI